VVRVRLLQQEVEAPILDPADCDGWPKFVVFAVPGGGGERDICRCSPRNTGKGRERGTVNRHEEIVGS
jgi:hypothetical protein